MLIEENKHLALLCFFFLVEGLFQMMAWVGEGEGGTLPVKQQVGFEPGTFWSTVECFNHLATVSLQEDRQPPSTNAL